MGKKESAAEIDEAAAAWAVRMDRGPLAPEQDALLEAWLAGDVRRQGAFAKACAVLIHADRAQALGPSYDPKNFLQDDGARRSVDRPGLPRRWALMSGGALAASVVVGGLGLILRGHYATKRGEVRIVPLGDGSSLTLNTSTKVAVRFSDDRRDVRLIEGEALFEVAKNPARPFVVDAGDVKVRAVGTSFTVRRLPSRATEVLVREGIVDIEPAPTALKPDAALKPVRLVANQAAIAKPAEAIAAVNVEPAVLLRELAWREGMISFEAMSLKDATEEFARYSDPKIVVDDPAVGSEVITGLFSADNPAGFAKAVALSLNLNAHTLGDEIHLSR